MRERPYLVGLTGSIGMGKSETGRVFARLGIPVFDADAAVHKLYESGEAVEAIAGVFPDAVSNGRIDRTALARSIGGDARKLRHLEAIVHPLVGREEERFIDQAAEAGAEIVVLDIPLLFETGKHMRMDAVVTVSAPAYVQRARVLARPGMTPEKLEYLLARQLPDAEKRAQAHFVVETGKGFDHAFEQVQKIVDALKERRRREQQRA